ncbi:hypothetical protein [Dictyobacter aurantiacus]|uniref:Uncharacterized protein n=1 Tax=Dictyobacter aurantiacus TaxID=1936993 RepID=A0A401ZP66_9CHLR|nr:hypothetical protein [Dictyobacter aurantiacus]GCE08651.1 hypothetical protein KDAU_59800 [Dictyobacter aurantiacus]
MNDVSLDFLNTDVELNDAELDELFINGLQANPPEDMVARIMNAVSALPQPKPLSQWQGFDFFFSDDTYDQLS